MNLLILTTAYLAVLAFGAPMKRSVPLDKATAPQFMTCEQFCEFIRLHGLTSPNCPCDTTPPAPASPSPMPPTDPMPPTLPVPTPTTAPPSDPALPVPTPPTAPVPPTDPVPAPPTGDKAATCLSEHNKERAAVGVPPVKWSTTLEASAQQWADTIKDEAGLRHSKGVFPGVGENLMASGGSSKLSWEEFQSAWINEKQYFQNGQFPDVSSTGNWMDVGHYTAMIWRGVTEIGCAAAEGNGWKFVCHYSPPPNMRGSMVY